MISKTNTDNTYTCTFKLDHDSVVKFRRVADHLKTRKENLTDSVALSKMIELCYASVFGGIVSVSLYEADFHFLEFLAEKIIEIDESADLEFYEDVIIFLIHFIEQNRDLLFDNIVDDSLVKYFKHS